MLNVKTPKGKKAEEDTREYLKLLSEKLNIDLVFYPIDSSSFVDGFVLVDDKLVSVFESKLRNAYYSENKIWFDGVGYDKYLITATKIDDGVRIAKANNLNYHLFVILSESNHVLSFRVYDCRDGVVIENTRKQTRTKFGVNGGEANRVNAFIDIKLAKIFHFDNILKI